jgi:hypothetical protein
MGAGQMAFGRFTIAKRCSGGNSFRCQPTGDLLHTIDMQCAALRWDAIAWCALQSIPMNCNTLYCDALQYDAYPCNAVHRSSMYSIALRFRRLIDGRYFPFQPKRWRW